MLSLGDSTKDHIFSSNAEMGRNEEGQLKGSAKHTVGLQIQPQYKRTTDNFIVKLLIKVYITKH